MSSAELTISIEWVSGDRSATVQWNYGVIQGDVSPQSYPEVPKPTTPASNAPKTYGTQTAFDVPSAVAHPVVYTHAPGQGHKATSGDYHRPANVTRNQWDPPVNLNTGGVAYHQIFRQQQLEFGEIAQQTEYGNWYYATENDESLTHQSGSDSTVRGQFLSNGYLNNTEDINYRAINDAYPIFGFSKNFGSVGSLAQSTLFQLSLHQQNSIQFLGDDGIQPVASLWTSYFSNDTEAVSRLQSTAVDVANESTGQVLLR